MDFNLKDGLEAWKLAVELLLLLGKVLPDGKEEVDKDLQSKLQTLRKDARVAATRFRDDLRKVREELWDDGIDLNKSLKQISDDLSFYQWIKGRKVKQAKTKMLASARELQSIYNDAAAVLLCFRKQHDLRDAFRASKDSIEQLSKDVDVLNAPIGDYLERLISEADNVVKDFG